MNTKTITRFTITYINRHGQRQLLGPNQGRCFKDTVGEAQQGLKSFVENNTEKQLKEVYGPQAIGTFAVRAVECYENGDAIGIFFDADLQDLQEAKAELVKARLEIQDCLCRVKAGERVWKRCLESSRDALFECLPIRLQGHADFPAWRERITKRSTRRHYEGLLVDVNQMIREMDRRIKKETDKIEKSLKP